MKRIQKFKKERDTILILTNGKQTEKNYFKSLTSNYETMFKIEVKVLNKQCDELVNYAAQLDKSSYNQIWCVFDIDDSYTEGHLIRAIKLAKQNNIMIAYSNEAFEVWLLYHLSNSVNLNLTRRTYIKELNSLLQNEGYNRAYKKNDVNLLKEKFISNALIAAQNAKKSYQKVVADYQKTYHNENYPIWDWKSTTTVYQLIESLQLKLKSNK